MEAKEKGTDSVRAVHRALDLLIAFGREDFELTAGELMKKVDLSRPTLYRLLYTLQEKGFITASGDPQRFRLGPAVARLSHVWTETLDLASLAEPVMKALWSNTRETVAVFVAQDDLRLCLAELPSPQPLSFKRGVGYTERIALGASGRAILAFNAGDIPVEKYLSGLKLDRAAFLAELEVTRQRGYSVSRNELIDGAVAVAAPFFNGHGVAGSIGVFGPASRLGEKSRLEDLGRQVVHSATALSAALGAGSPAPPRSGGPAGKS